MLFFNMVCLTVELVCSVIIGDNINAGLVSWKGVDLTLSRYIGRVPIEMSTEVIMNYLNGRGVDVIELTPNETKNNRFLSFKLVIRKSHLHILEDDDFWPKDVVVNHFFGVGGPPSKELRLEMERENSGDSLSNGFQLLQRRK
jgi:hypothetical protein